MITVKNTVIGSIDKVWELWTLPEHIMNWNTPGEDWHTSYAENDLKVAGKFKFTMSSKDLNVVFDFEGFYTKIEKNKVIAYKLGDDRIASVHFEQNGNKVNITEIFEPQKQDSESMQQEWCQAVIDNFKNYAECL